MVAPAGVPQAIVSTLSAEVARIVQLPDVAQRFQLDGAEAVGSTPTEFTAFLKAEMQKWSKVVRDAGIKPEQ
jgi:tripartite-type tricarboxylate transporter receptor subunit TctC